MFKYRLYFALAVILFANRLVYAAGLLAISNPAKQTQGYGVFLEGEAFQGQDHNQINNKWTTAPSNNEPNVAILFGRAEAGLQTNNLKISRLRRIDAVMTANRDTAQLSQQNVTGPGYDTNRVYNLDYRIRGFEASGLKMSTSLNLPLSNNWTLNTGVALSLLKGNQLKQESITGQIIATSSNELTGNAQQFLSNSNINTADINVFNAPYNKQLPFSGEGFAIDTGILLKHEPTGALLELAVADIAGAMDWYNVPNYDAKLNLANQYIDANGYINFNPTATSVSSYRNIHQNLSPKIRIALMYPVESWEFSAATDHTQGYTFIQTSVGYHLASFLSIKLEYDWRYKTVGVGLKNNYFDIMLRTDTTQPDTAKALGVHANIRLVW